MLRTLIKFTKKYGKERCDEKYGEWEQWSFWPFRYGEHVAFGPYFDIFGITIFDEWMEKNNQ